MKLLHGVVLAALAGGCGQVSAQGLLGADASQVHSTSDMSSSGSVAAIMNPVTGAPYSASKVTRTVWKLGDGTTIRHEAETKIARDAEGRVREDVEVTQAMSMGAKQINHTTESVMIADPVDHSLTTWSGKLKMAMRVQMPDFGGLKPPVRLGSAGMPMGGILSVPPPPSPPRRSGSIEPGTTGEIAGPVPQDVKKEDLGKQSIAGVLATGKRTTTVIHRGVIGNDQDITVVHEEWYSPELKVVVKTFDSDPRSGDRTMELEGLDRGEPDAALFHAPEGYEVKDMAQMMKGLGSLGEKK